MTSIDVEISDSYLFEQDLQLPPSSDVLAISL
jgi:hypothetical protein